MAEDDGAPAGLLVTANRVRVRPADVDPGDSVHDSPANPERASKTTVLPQSLAGGLSVDRR